jgi:hypothetical protein
LTDEESPQFLFVDLSLRKELNDFEDIH